MLAALTRSCARPPPPNLLLGAVLRHGVDGVAFKRQVVLGDRYIADFVAPSVRLFVEVDGGVHRDRRTADRCRDRNLRALGYGVVRVEAALVLRSPECAVAVVQAALGP